MPYEVSFAQRVPLTDREQYINECCVGGDVVAERLLPVVRSQYTDVDTGQEDWGWFIWFRKGRVKLAIDIHTDAPERGEFRMRLTSRSTRFLVFDSIVDTPELEDLRTLVESELATWIGAAVTVQHDSDAT